jgi:hypothetical protein
VAGEEGVVGPGGDREAGGTAMPMLMSSPSDAHLPPTSEVLEASHSSQRICAAAAPFVDHGDGALVPVHPHALPGLDLLGAEAGPDDGGRPYSRETIAAWT